MSDVPLHQRLRSLQTWLDEMGGQYDDDVATLEEAIALARVVEKALEVPPGSRVVVLSEEERAILEVLCEPQHGIIDKLLGDEESLLRRLAGKVPTCSKDPMQEGGR